MPYKKILSFMLLSLFIFPNLSISKELATWGFVGSKCNQTIKVVNEFGRTGKDALGYSIQGFLTGYNSHVMLMDLQRKSSIKAKVINKFSIKEVTDILIGKCTANPTKATYVALIEIWRTFPDARY